MYDETRETECHFRYLADQAFILLCPQLAADVVGYLFTELARLDVFDGHGEVLRTDWLIGEPTKGWQ